jgi:anti-anti-sigma factor
VITAYRPREFDLAMSSKHSNHWLEREDLDAVTLVRLKTPRHLDEEVIRDVFDPVYSLVSEAGRGQLVLNFAAVTQFPSLAVGKLVMLNRKVQSVKGRLVLCCLTPTVRQTLENTRLIDLSTVCETEEDALGRMKEE